MAISSLLIFTNCQTIGSGLSLFCSAFVYVKKFVFGGDTYPNNWFIEYAKGAEYGIYVLDKWGNRAELYRDAEISCFQPVPLRPHCAPVALATCSAPPSSPSRALSRLPGQVSTLAICES